MRKPVIGKPRTAQSSLSLSRRLPKLSLPGAAAPASPARPKPKVGRPKQTPIAGRIGRK
ncbi:MAG TPA: hypothetical protein VF618_11055 [Thermoanaerobaculia bacterium]